MTLHPASARPPRLSLRGITKHFPGCLANDAIDLDLLPGEIHGLVGQNGAGKSTLVKIIDGLLRPDAGTMRWQGQPVATTGPATARRLGIAMVFQHFSLFDSLTVAENVWAGLDWPGGLAALARRITDVSRRYGLPLDPARPVHTLSTGERQRVEIVRCLLQNPRLLIMDEPTSVLTPQEAETLFRTLRQLAAEDCTILYISHKLEEVRHLCDRASVLRAGRIVGTVDPKATSAETLAQLMIGDPPSPPQRPQRPTAGAPRLELVQLSTASDLPFATNLNGINLSVRGGEIVGIAGVAGNGQAELLAALSGEWRGRDPAAIRIEGQPAGDLGPTERRALGVAVVPEERLGRAVVPDLDLADNTLLGGTARRHLVRSGLIRFARTHAYAERIIAAFDVVARGSRDVARRLSGGNLQKFILGREILERPRLLVAANPTWGVDIGAAAAVHQALFDLARDGAAVLILSTDLDELFTVSDRIAVICAGRLSPTRPVHGTTVEQIGLWMGGLFEPAGREGPVA